ncbi:MAG TPA: radical SAM protein [Myxococcota bacterium]|nr:radical SAM protein [Myxococcota bacterium]HRY95359.1 radical SAM protein [Myxococcota bacterium]HSA22213.1 radical SAM protein [Myxococcota bacterium]
MAGAGRGCDGCGRSLSRHLVTGGLAGGRGFALSALSGAADLLAPGELEALRDGRLEPGELAARGYLVRGDEERAALRRAYLDFLDERERDEVQLFFVPRYACNFGCAYCYQAGYQVAAEPVRPEVVEAFFGYVRREFAGRRAFVTLFGGEPLLPGAEARTFLEDFAGRARAAGLPLAVVTNGYHLEDSLPALGRAELQEIQVTLDGPRAVHDARRPLKGGGPTFERVAAGLDAALRAGHPVNLRVVVDRDNLGDLPELAAYAAARGWTGHPRFKAHLGRSYELHTCGPAPGRLFDRLGLARAFQALARQRPEVLALVRPPFGVARELAERGALPAPLFDACPGCKTEWAFDFTGHIYACTATVGAEGEALGTFWPEARLDEAAVEEWRGRDVLSIPECRECGLQLLCGGGCAALARRRTGRLRGPDCRPARELIELGLDLYLGEERA